MAPAPPPPPKKKKFNIKIPFLIITFNRKLYEKLKIYKTITSRSRPKLTLRFVGAPGWGCTSGWFLIVGPVVLPLLTTPVLIEKHHKVVFLLVIFDTRVLCTVSLFYESAAAVTEKELQEGSCYLVRAATNVGITTLHTVYIVYTGSKILGLTRSRAHCFSPGYAHKITK